MTDARGGYTRRDVLAAGIGLGVVGATAGCGAGGGGGPAIVRVASVSAVKMFRDFAIGVGASLTANRIQDARAAQRPATRAAIDRATGAMERMSFADMAKAPVYETSRSLMFLASDAGGHNCCAPVLTPAPRHVDYAFVGGPAVVALGYVANLVTDRKIRLGHGYANDVLLPIRELDRSNCFMFDKPGWARYQVRFGELLVGYEPQGEGKGTFQVDFSPRRVRGVNRISHRVTLIVDEAKGAA